MVISPRAHVQHAHELEGRGARIDEHGVAIAHQLKGGASDGLLGIDIHVDALILDRNGQGLVQRDGSAVRAPEFAGSCERIKVAAGRNGRDAESLCDVGDLHGSAVFEHVHDGRATLLGERAGCGCGHGSLLANRVQNVMSLFCIIFFLRNKKSLFLFRFITNANMTKCARMGESFVSLLMGVCGHAGHA